LRENFIHTPNLTAGRRKLQQESTIVQGALQPGIASRFATGWNPAAGKLFHYRARFERLPTAQAHTSRPSSAAIGFSKSDGSLGAELPSGKEKALSTGQGLAPNSSATQLTR